MTRPFTPSTRMARPLHVRKEDAAGARGGVRGRRARASWKVAGRTVGRCQCASSRRQASPAALLAWTRCGRCHPRRRRHRRRRRCRGESTGRRCCARCHSPRAACRRRRRRHCRCRRTPCALPDSGEEQQPAAASCGRTWPAAGHNSRRRRRQARRCRLQRCHARPPPSQGRGTRSREAWRLTPWETRLAPQRALKLFRFPARAGPVCFFHRATATAPAPGRSCTWPPAPGRPGSA